MRRAARTDANHAEIVKAARKMGCTVLDLSGVGSGCPDLLVSIQGKNLLIEVKDSAKPPSARKLTPDQIKFHAAWKGPIAIVESVADLIEIIRMQP